MTGEVNAPVIAREPRITVYTMVTGVASPPPPAQPRGLLGLPRLTPGVPRGQMRVAGTSLALRLLARQEIHSVIPGRENTRMSGTSGTP